MHAIMACTSAGKGTHGVKEKGKAEKPRITARVETRECWFKA